MPVLQSRSFCMHVYLGLHEVLPVCFDEARAIITLCTQEVCMPAV